MERKAVTNTSSLIFIAKLNIFDITKNLFSEIFVPKQVINEIFDKDFPENKIIKKELGKFLKEVNVKKVRDLSIGDGEKAAISYCIDKKINTFLSDDKKARRFAQSFGIETIGVLGILLFNLQNKKIKKQDFLNFFNKLIEKGYYVSPGLYAKIMDLIKE